jgi:hypothetical protein
MNPNDLDQLDLFMGKVATPRQTEHDTAKPLSGNGQIGAVSCCVTLESGARHTDPIDTILLSSAVSSVSCSKGVYGDLEHGVSTYSSTIDGWDLLARVKSVEHDTDDTPQPNELIHNELTRDALETAIFYSQASKGNSIKDLTRVMLENTERDTGDTAEVGSGIEVDKNVQGWHPGAHEGSGACPPRAPKTGVRECDEEFLRLLDPEFKFDFEFRPGDHLPVWAVEVLASYPLLPDCWWGDEGFQLAAAGFGFHRKPDHRPPMAEDPTTREWEVLAMRVLDGGIKISNSSEFRAIEIGIRGLPRSRICAEAVQKIDASRPKKK